MIIEYCNTCGVRVREPDLQSGAAIRDKEDRVLCPECTPGKKLSGAVVAASKQTGQLPRDAAKLRESRTTTRTVRSPGRTTALPSERRPAATTRASGLPPQVLIGGGVAVVLLIVVAALLMAEKDPALPKSAKHSPPKSPSLPIRPTIPDETNPATTPNPRPAPDQATTPAKPSTPPAGKKAVSAIRENYARRLWEELKNKTERDPAAQWGTQKALQDFIGSYGSTEAGKEAAEYLKARADEMPPPPTPERIIAALKADYAKENPKTGWQYLWNAKGKIGQSANYKPMAWNVKQQHYAGNANSYPQKGTPHHYLRLQGDGGHPGAGSGQPESGGIDRFAIAAYTIQAGQAGKIAITGRVNCPESPGRIELRLFVNDEIKGSSKKSGGGPPLIFSTWLGGLKEGDTIYVAVGPDQKDGNDSFKLSFLIYK